jgi:glutathione S-transferase
MTQCILYLGNKNYSSWSMRPWLALRWAGIAFEEKVIPLGGPGYGKSKIAEVVAVSPSGKVPALQVGEVTIWDSMAICEWAAEQNASLWPSDWQTRACARSVSLEMHSGFASLRRDLSMNIRRRCKAYDLPADTLADIARLDELWSDMRTAHGAGGAFLFGARSIADAMFAPVATRFRTYNVKLSPTAQAYCDTLLHDNDFRVWERDALEETWAIGATDALYP